MKVLLETFVYGFIVAAVAILLSVVIPKHAHAETMQVGQASWYGGFHHGRKMANGKPFNMYANTVAHRTLPLGTVVKVTNRNNGRTVTATVTDRGPYAKRRVLDVSRGIASKLDMIKSGVATVEITVLSKPTPKSKRNYSTRQSVEVSKPLPKPIVVPKLEQDSIEALLAELSTNQTPPLWVRNN